MVDIGKLSKHDLLLILRDQEIELKQVKAENVQLKSELETALAQAQVQQSLGSIAEESVKVAGVMQAAQQAADEYVAKVKARHASLEEEMAMMLAETKSKCDRMEFESRYKADQAWENVKKKLDDYCLAHSELNNLLGQTDSIVSNLK